MELKELVPDLPSCKLVADSDFPESCFQWSEIKNRANGISDWDVWEREAAAELLPDDFLKYPAPTSDEIKADIAKTSEVYSNTYRNGKTAVIVKHPDGSTWVSEHKIPAMAALDAWIKLKNKKPQPAVKENSI